MKAFIFDPLWDELITDDLISKLKSSGLELVVTSEITRLTDKKELFEGDDDRILCLNPDYVGWKLASDDYKNIPNLKAILTASTSFSWIDTSYADQNNIPICNIRNFSTEAVAEWGVTMLLNVARQVPRLIKDGFPLDMDKDYMNYRGVELHGKTAGIIGLGNIGSAIAERLQGLGLEVVYWSKSPKEVDYKYMELPQLFTEADVIFPTMALNDETKNIITPELLMTLKPSCIFIAIEHHLFDTKVVLEMVKDSKLFGFGFETEPASFDKYDGNVWAAPAYAWATDQTMANAMDKWIDNMIQTVSGKFPNKVN